MNYPDYNIYSAGAAYPPAGYYQSEEAPQVYAYPSMPAGFAPPPVAPHYGIIGFQPVPRPDPQRPGLMVIEHQPVYGYFYPEYLPCPRRSVVRPPASAAPAPASPAPRSANTTPPSANPTPPAASAPTIEKKNPESAVPKDLKLPSDHVGLAVATPEERARIDSRPIVEEFFGTSESKGSFDYPEILKKYLAKVKTKDRKQYIPLRYQELFDKLNSDNSYQAWADALLHNPPIEMLKSLNRIQSIFTTFQASAEQNLVPLFFFPCSMAIPDSIKQKFKFHPRLNELIEKQDRMVLELTLNKEGKALHVFFRPLRQEESFLEKNLGDSKEKVCQALDHNAFPALRFPSKPPRSVTQTQRMVETDTHLEFYFQEGITIKALKA